MTVPSDPSILVDGRRLPVLVRRYPNARRCRLRIAPDGSALRLSLPQRYSLARALDWAASQEGWVRGQLTRSRDAVALVPGATFPLEGREVRIAWHAAAPRTPRLEGDRLLLGGPEDAAGRRLVRWLRDRALATLAAETREVAARESLSVASVRVGDPRSRWGSCTSAGAIRYSWRLIMAPDHVRRAIVAHEVAHLLHMDHGPDFHAAHARLLGCNPAPASRWLREHGPRLHLIG